MWNVPGGIYTIPGGFGRLHLADGATPCNCPSFGSELPLLPLLQLDNATIADTATRENNKFFIVFNFEGIEQI